MIRSPWHRAAGWSPEEAAAELQRRRAELISQFRRRSEARGVPVVAHEDIVDDAITAVVMESSRGIENEQHLLGAFWSAVDIRCKRHHEGRHFTRLGSRQRVEFDAAVASVAAIGGPFEAVELTDRMARAADLIAELDARERQVFAVMAVYGVGPLPASRHLGITHGEARSAARSAKFKLEHVAAIAAKGRMCNYRSSAIAADAAGEASDHDAGRARAHVNACVPCGRVYRKLRREMRGRDFQRAAAAAFLPLPAPLAHLGGFGRLAAWFEQHTPRVLPHGGGERAAEVLGGAGAVKVATAGALIAAAGTTFAGHIVHTTFGSHAPAHHRAAHIARETSSESFQRASLASAWANPTATIIPASPRAADRSTAPSSRRITAHVNVPAPPSKSLGYLALGSSSAGGSESGSPSSSTSSSPARATVASVDKPASSSPSTSSPSSEPSSPPAQSGGGIGLGYLGQ
jgi:DNA-directed RNA polymerase specialized sigma24 family protein